MHFHGAYFSNYIAWVIDPVYVSPSGYVVLDFLYQGDINAVSGGFYMGICVTLGIFYIWCSSGIISFIELRGLAVLLLLFSLIFIFLGYLHLKYLVLFLGYFEYELFCFFLHHTVILVGVASIFWSGHLVYVSVPVSVLLFFGVDIKVLSLAFELLFFKVFLVLLFIFNFVPYLFFDWVIFFFYMV
jgi:photosystem I P700 chlorophyll a apoprotein A1